MAGRADCFVICFLGGRGGGACPVGVPIGGGAADAVNGPVDGAVGFGVEAGGLGELGALKAGSDPVAWIRADRRILIVLHLSLAVTYVCV